MSTAHKTPEEIHVMAEENFPPLPPKAAAKEMGQLALLFTVVRHPFSRYFYIFNPLSLMAYVYVTFIKYVTRSN